MKTVSISGSPRVNVGKKDAKGARKNGLVPCVLYGGKEQLTFTLAEKELGPLIYTPEVLAADLTIEGKKYTAVLQEIQLHVINDKLQHIDFLEVTPGKPIIIALPIKTVGTSQGVREGGKLLKKVRTVKVKGLFEKLPSEVQIDVTELKIGGSVCVGDLKIDGIEFVDSPNLTIVSVNTTRNVVAEGGAAAPAAAAKAPAAKAAAPAAAKAPEKKK
jgi:large subunit ribosomal protein L25